MLKRLVGEELVAADDSGEHTADFDASVATADAQAVTAEVVTASVVTDHADTDVASAIDDANDFDDEPELIVGEKISDDEGDVVVDTELLYDQADEQEEIEEEPQTLWSSLTSGDSQAFLLSLIVHTVLILSLALIPILSEQHEPAIVLTELPAADTPEELTVTEDLAFADEPAENMGANSVGETGMALSTASIVADVPSVETISTQMPIVSPSVDLGSRIQQPSGLVKSEMAVKGMTGVGTTGTDGAIDRITYEILQKMEEKPTLVVWFFDQSISLMRRRQEIRDRFDRIYQELGLVQEDDKKRKRASWSMRLC